MHIETFLNLINKAVATHLNNANGLLSDDGTVSPDDVITYIHQVAVADSLDEMAVIILQSMDAAQTIQESKGIIRH